MFYHYFKKNEGLFNKPFVYFMLLLLVAAYFLWLNSSFIFPDPDSFYHAKLSKLIWQNGIVYDFYWLPFTTLSDVYIDHHLLYHLIMAPLTGVFDPLVVTKLLGVFFASLFIFVFYVFLQKMKIRFAWLYVLVLLASHQFIFRLNLAKIPALSLIFLFIFLWFLFAERKKYSLIFVICFLYVWLYGGWPIMLGIGVIYLLVAALTLASGEHGKLFLKNLFTWTQLKLAGSILAGFLAGIVFNPYFPRNLVFYWQQTWKIGLLNYKDVIGVGGEWYGFNVVDLVGQDVFVFILFVAALSIFVVNIKEQKAREWTLLAVSLIFFALTVKSRRNIEYFIPFSLLFSAFAINGLWQRYGWRKIQDSIAQLFKKYRQAGVIILILLAAQVPIVAAFNFGSLRQALRTGYGFSDFQGVGAWLAENSSRGDVVFHDNWSDWPALFYSDSYNRYIVGLDPSFLYFQDKDIYWLWHDIAVGKVTDNVCLKVNEAFGARLVLVKLDNAAMLENIVKDDNCQEAYRDDNAAVYKLK